MSNNVKKLVKSPQMSLFDTIKSQNEKTNTSFIGALNIISEFRQIISRVIAASGLSRYQISAKMSELLDQEVTANMLYNWTAESKEQYRFPAEFLPAFCEVVKSYEPIQFLAEKMALFLMPGEEALRSEIQKIEEKMKDLEKEKDKRLFFLKEIQGNGKE